MWRNTCLCSFVRALNVKAIKNLTLLREWVCPHGVWTAYPMWKSAVTEDRAVSTVLNGTEGLLVRTTTLLLCFASHQKPITKFWGITISCHCCVLKDTDLESVVLPALNFKKLQHPIGAVQLALDCNWIGFLRIIELEQYSCRCSNQQMKYPTWSPAECANDQMS